MIKNSQFVCLLVFCIWLPLLFSLSAEALPYQIVKDTPLGETPVQVDGNQALFVGQNQAQVWDLQQERVQYQIKLSPEQVSLQNSSTDPNTWLNYQTGANPTRCQAGFVKDKLVSACANQSGLSIWNRQSGRKLKELKQHPVAWINFPYRPCQTPTFETKLQLKDHLAARQEAIHTFKVFDRQSKHLTYAHIQDYPIQRMVNSEQVAALLLLNQEIRVYDLKSGKLMYQLSANGQNVSDFSLDNTRLAVSYQNGRIGIWNAKGQQELNLPSQTNQKLIQVIDMPYVLGCHGLSLERLIGSPPTQMTQFPHPFSELLLRDQHLIGKEGGQVTALHIKSLQRQTYRLPDWENETHFKKQNNWVYGWSNCYPGKTCPAWAIDLSQAKVYEHLTAQDQKLQVQNTKDTVSLSIPPNPRFENGNLLYQGENKPPFSLQLSDQAITAQQIITHGIDTKTEVWDLESLSLAYQQELNEAFVPHNDQQVLKPESILSWQLNADGIWVIETDPVLKSKHYVWNQKQAIERFYQTTPLEGLAKTENQVLLLEPKQMIAIGPGGAFHIDLKTGKRFNYQGQFPDENNYTVVNEWLVQTRFNEDKYQSEIQFWQLDQALAIFKTTVPKSLHRPEDWGGGTLGFSWYENAAGDNEVNEIEFHYLTLHPEVVEPVLLMNPARCNHWQTDSWTQSWLNWRQNCFQLEGQQILRRAQKQNPQVAFQLPPTRRYYDGLTQMGPLLTIQDNQGQAQILDLEYSIQGALSGQINIARVTEKNLSFMRVIGEPFPGRIWQYAYIYIPRHQLSELSQRDQLITHIYSDGAIVIAPDGNYAGWGNYQQYLHFTNAQGQMIPWPDAEGRWHKPQILQQKIVNLSH